MNPRERIRMIMLIGKLKGNPEFADKIAVKDTSYFRKQSRKK